jgi:hypothetical protein
MPVSRIPVISDAQPSADEQLRHRRRTYTVIMTIHLVGFAVGASLYEVAWWAGLVILIVTGPLQWIAVVIANAAPRSRCPDRRLLGRGAPPARARLADVHITHLARQAWLPAARSAGGPARARPPG